MRQYANVLLAAKGPCVSSAFQALQIATSSVAEAVWCGSAVVVDGMTEWSGAEVAGSLVWIAACGYGRRAVTAVSTPTCCLLPKRTLGVQCAPCAADCASSSVARAVWCGSGVIVDGKTEWSGAEVADSLVWIAACVGMEGGLSPR